MQLPHSLPAGDSLKMRNYSPFPSLLFLQQHNSEFSQNPVPDPSISLQMCNNMSETAHQISLHSEGLETRQAQLNHAGTAFSSGFSYLTPNAHASGTMNSLVPNIINGCSSSNAEKERHFGPPFQSEILRDSRKRPLEEFARRDGIFSMINNTTLPDESHVSKRKTIEETVLKEMFSDSRKHPLEDFAQRDGIFRMINNTCYPDESQVSKRKTIEKTVMKAPARRSQKLSDKITSLQKVVSPYGKTDTASVLQEACMYIKIAHQEIRRLKVSYFGSRPLQTQLIHSNVEKWYPDLQSKGLCLVPLSMASQLAIEDSADVSNSNQGAPNIMNVWGF